MDYTDDHRICYKYIYNVYNGIGVFIEWLLIGWQVNQRVDADLTDQI